MKSNMKNLRNKASKPYSAAMFKIGRPLGGVLVLTAGIGLTACHTTATQDKVAAQDSFYQQHRAAAVEKKAVEKKSLGKKSSEKKPLDATHQDTMLARFKNNEGAAADASNEARIEKEKTTPPVLTKVNRELNIQVGSTNTLLSPSAATAIDQLAKEVAKWDEVKRIRVVGHTDSEGSEESNIRLAKQRAEAAAARMLAVGIDKSKLEIDSKGELEPIADNTSVYGRARNRRVEIIVEGLSARKEDPQAEETLVQAGLEAGR